jgi:hypothetical protein
MDAVVLVVVLMWMVFFALTLRWARITSPGASIATWLGLTVVTWAIEFAVAFITLHAILFLFDREAAIVASIVSVAIMTLTPAALMFGLGYWNTHRSVHE